MTTARKLKAIDDIPFLLSRIHSRTDLRQDLRTLIIDRDFDNCMHVSNMPKLSLYSLDPDMMLLTQFLIETQPLQMIRFMQIKHQADWCDINNIHFNLIVILDKQCVPEQTPPCRAIPDLVQHRCMYSCNMLVKLAITVNSSSDAALPLWCRRWCLIWNCIFSEKKTSFL